jgi:hypothetical protein
MNIQEVAESFTTKMFVSKDLDSAASYLAEDFQFSGPVPEPVDSKQWLGLMKAMNAAFPDINYHTRILGVDGNVVKTASQLSGTHTNDLDLSTMGLGVIPATGKSFSIPEEQGEATVKDGKITSMHLNTGQDSGLMGILKQLGVEPPQG